MGVSKNMGTPPNHPFVHRVFHEINHPFRGFFIPLFWFNTHHVAYSTLQVEEKKSEPAKQESSWDFSGFGAEGSKGMCKNDVRRYLPQNQPGAQSLLGLCMHFFGICH